MDQYSKNGNGGVVTILPPASKVIRGVSLVHRGSARRSLRCWARISKTG
jgi:hypothetical protein